MNLGWRTLRRILGLILVLATFIGAVFAQDATPSEGNVVIVASAFVRSGPADSYVPVGALYAGDKVTPLNISEDGFWILIPYSRGNGWIQRNLVQWEDDAALDLLPVMPADITPTPRIEFTNTPFIPTFTPVGNYVSPINAQSAYVRAGPGRGYLRLGQLRPGELVTPLARNAETTWIMIPFQLSPFQEGFGWVAADLITWQDPDSLNDLPIINENNLTPTATFTASVTAAASSTATASPSATSTDEPSATATASLTATLTDTATSEPSTTPSETATNTAEPSATATDTATSTTEPSATPSETATNTTEPSATATDTATATTEPSATPSETATNTTEPSATATDTATDAPGATASPTNEPNATATETALPPTTEAAVVVVFPSETPTNAPTNTPEPSATLTETTAPTDIFAVQGTSAAVNATTAPTSEPNPENTPPPLVEETVPASGFSIPLEAIVGLIVLVLVAVYIGLYMQGLSAASRYKAGFVVDTCPVCQRGHLHVEERPNRLLGIPMVRRTVRCDECRSVLRETGNHRWRYAVDRIENPVMFDRFNGREVTDSDLERLLKQPPKNTSARTNPTFVDDEQGN